MALALALALQAHIVRLSDLYRDSSGPSNDADPPTQFQCGRVPPESLLFGQVASLVKSINATFT